MQEKIRSTLLTTLTTKAKPYEVFDTDLKGFLVRVEPSGLMTYFVACRTKAGTRRRIRLGATAALTPAQARDEARKIIGDIARGADPQADLQAKRKKNSEQTLLTFIEGDYSTWAKTHLGDADNALRRLKVCFFELMAKKLSSIDGWAFETWRAQRKKSGAKASTINRDMAGMRSALSRAVDWGLLLAHPMAKVKAIREAENIVVRYLSDDEETRLRHQLDIREDRIKRGRESGNEWRRARGYREYPDLSSVAVVDYVKPMVLVSLNTGLRRGELFALQWTDIDWNATVLTVRGATAKSKKTRTVPMNEEVQAALKEWQDASTKKTGLIFATAKGNTRDNTKRVWKKLLCDAGIQAFRWHDMRHHFASRLVMVGVDLNTVRELLGHADLKMTLRYAHLAPEHKAAAVAKLVRNTHIEVANYAEAA